MFTTVLTWFGAAAALLSPVLTFVAVRLRTRRGELDDLHGRLDQRDATIAALWSAYLDLRYWLVKGQAGNPPTLPATLTVAAVRDRLTA